MSEDMVLEEIKDDHMLLEKIKVRLNSIGPHYPVNETNM